MYLDVALCLNIKNFIGKKIFHSPFSDHALIAFMFNFKKIYPKKIEFESRILNPKNMLLIKNSLGNILQQFKIEHDNVSQHWQSLKDVIISVRDRVAPLKKFKQRSEVNLPYFDKELILLASIRDKTYKQAITEKDHIKNKQLFSYYKVERKNFQSTLKKKKFEFYNKLIESESLSSKKLWQSTSAIINPNKKSIIIPNLILKGHDQNTTLDAANQFINFFSSILVKFIFIPIAFCLTFLENHFNKNMKILVNFKKSFDFLEITPEEVLNELKSLDPTSSKGAVGIETKIFKQCANELAKPLADLFNNCIKNNFIPLEWKLAHLTPNYKGKGSKSDINNYRPLSVLSPIAKVYESLLAIRITNYFEENNLFNKSQFGFRKGLSCELALNTFVETIRENINKSEHTISIMLDLSKAFDTINHEILLAKLKKYKFSDSALKTIKNYLSDRTMRVNIDKTLSKTEFLKVGVPQGSVLGPLLFIIFLNDIFALLINSSLIVFADDTTTIYSGEDLVGLMRKVENDMKIICEWLENNQLLINKQKIVAIHFPTSSNYSKQIIEPRPENLTIKVDGYYTLI